MKHIEAKTNSRVQLRGRFSGYTEGMSNSMSSYLNEMHLIEMHLNEMHLNEMHLCEMHLCEMHLYGIPFVRYPQFSLSGRSDALVGLDLCRGHGCDVSLHCHWPPSHSLKEPQGSQTMHCISISRQMMKGAWRRQRSWQRAW